MGKPHVSVLVRLADGEARTCALRGTALEYFEHVPDLRLPSISLNDVQWETRRAIPTHLLERGLRVTQSQREAEEGRLARRPGRAACGPMSRRNDVNVCKQESVRALGQRRFPHATAGLGLSRTSELFPLGTVHLEHDWRPLTFLEHRGELVDLVALGYRRRTSAFRQLPGGMTALTSGRPLTPQMKSKKGSIPASAAGDCRPSSCELAQPGAR